MFLSSLVIKICVKNGYERYLETTSNLPYTAEFAKFIFKRRVSSGVVFFFCFDENSGKTINVPLKYPRLQAGSFPVNFPNCPSYISIPESLHRKSRDEKNFEKDRENLAQALRERMEEFQAYKKSTFLKILKNFYIFSNHLFFQKIGKKPVILKMK